MRTHTHTHIYARTYIINYYIPQSILYPEPLLYDNAGAIYLNNCLFGEKKNNQAISG